MQCKKCGEVQDDKYKFCKKCGAPLTEQESKCAHCGESIEPDSTFCPFCGAAVNESSTASAQPVDKPAAVQANGQSFYDSYNATAVKREHKPLVIGQKGQYIGAMVKAWVLTALFLLMFGLSFLSFAKMDISDTLTELKGMFGIVGIDVSINDEYLEPIDVSPIDVIAVTFSKKLTMQEALSKLKKPHENIMKLMCCQEIMKSMPFSMNVTLILFTIVIFALMLGSFTFGVLFLIEALGLTIKGKSVLKKDIAGLGLGIMTAIALFILSLTMGDVGGGPLSAMIICLSALVLNTVYNGVIGGKRPESVKRLVSRCVSLALGITLLFTLNCKTYAIKTDIKVQPIYGKAYVKTVSEGYAIHELMEGVDLFVADEDSLIKLGDVALSDIVGVIDSEDNDIFQITNEDILSDVAPPNLYFYAEMNSGYNALGFVLGLLSFITYFMTGISLAVLLAFLMISLTDYKRRSTFATHLLSLIGFAAILVVSIICPATASLILKQLDYGDLFRCAICAAPIINLVLVIGMFVQHCVLDRKKKKE